MKQLPLVNLTFAQLLTAALVRVLGLDNGANQARHAGRVPGYINAKPERAGFRTQLLTASGAEADAAILNGLYRDQVAIEKEARVRARQKQLPVTARQPAEPRTPEYYYVGEADRSVADIKFALYAAQYMGLYEESIAADIVRARRTDDAKGFRGKHGAGWSYTRHTVRKAVTRVRGIAPAG